MNKMTFKDMQLEEALLKAIDGLGYHTPTPVQAQVIPALMAHSSVVVKSQTGSGKTAAFGIPIINDIDWEDNPPQVLVLTPTRELAEQVKDELFNIGRFKRMKVVAVYGKTPIRSQIKALKEKTHIVVGTPGRVKDHLLRGTLSLAKVKHLVLDEADEMLNMGFLDDVEDIINKCPSNSVTSLLSATMPEKIKYICQRYIEAPVYIEIEGEQIKGNIKQVKYKVNPRNKMQMLMDTTQMINPQRCIIFCNTRVSVDQVNEDLRRKGYKSDAIHGGMMQEDRTKVMANFRKGYFRYLVATDVAARGIDIDDLSLVVNYDLPEEGEVYVHRIGRTGRKGTDGHAISLVADRDGSRMRTIEALVDEEILWQEGPSLSDLEGAQQAFESRMASKLEVKDDKAVVLNKGILKLHINAGKKTKMRAGDVVGAICNIDGLTADDIGIISIVDVSTFVEILNDKGETVLKALQNTPIKGRMRKVSRSNGPT